MSYYVYMLKSRNKKNITYVGYTKDLQNRIRLHNIGKGAKFTRGSYWTLLFKKKYSSKSEAMKNEYVLKRNYKLRKKIKDNFYNNG